MNSIDIFTDASYKHSITPEIFGIGIYAIDYNNDEKEYFEKGIFDTESVQQKYSGKIGILLFELYAIYKSLKFITRKYKSSDVDEINIYTDNLIAFKMMNSLCKKKKYTTICDKIMENIEYLNSSNTIINISWIKAHCNVYGNKKADHLANHKEYTKSYQNDFII